MICVILKVSMLFLVLGGNKFSLVKTLKNVKILLDKLIIILLTLYKWEKMNVRTCGVARVYILSCSSLLLIFSSTISILVSKFNKWINE